MSLESRILHKLSFPIKSLQLSQESRICITAKNMAHFLADDVQKAVSVHSGKSKEIESTIAESSLQAVEGN